MAINNSHGKDDDCPEYIGFCRLQAAWGKQTNAEQKITLYIRKP